MTLAITPKNAANILVIEVVAAYSPALASWAVAALFQDTTVDAIASIISYDVTNGGAQICTFRHYMVAGTVSATTFKLRIGVTGATTVTFNGVAGARKLGGSMSSSITITEITP